MTAQQSIKIELLIDKDCPNVEPARGQIRRALEQFRLDPVWQEYQTGSPSIPAYMRGLGSPSILINEKDVSGWEAGEDNNCCRVYNDTSGRMQGVPAFESVTEAIRSAMLPDEKSKITSEHCPVDSSPRGLNPE